MPMSSQSVPHLRETAVAESKKASDKPVEKLAEPQHAAPAPKLAPAGASGDAGVQNLLAERTTHLSNGDDEKVADVDRRLAELGYTAQ